MIEIEDWLSKPQQPKDLSLAVAVMKELNRHADNMTKYTDLPDPDEAEKRYFFLPLSGLIEIVKNLQRRDLLMLKLRKQESVLP